MRWAEKIDILQLLLAYLGMLAHIQPDPTHQICNHCVKNTSLIKKYQQLIKLYKKKQVRLSIDGSSRISNLKTSCHTIEVCNTDVNCIKIVQVLSASVRREYAQGWKKLNKNIDSEMNKLAILRISNLLSKVVKSDALTSIRQAANKGNEINILEQTASFAIQKKMNNRQNNGKSVIQQFISESPFRVEQIQKSFISTLQDIKKKVLTQNNCFERSHRQKISLEIQVKFLTLENLTLKQLLQDFQRRQMKQNEKKRQSLEMLAEEISQKNDEIIHLKTALKKYQDDGGENNMLDENVATLKYEVGRLERIRQKLNGDIEKVKQQVRELQTKLKQYESSNQKLQTECTEMREKKFEAQISLNKSEKVRKQFSSVISRLQKKIKRFITYEKEFQVVGQNNGIPNFSEGLTQELKSQFILMYLSNISEPNYALQRPQLFDSEQITFLQNHKSDWCRLNNDIKMMQQIESRGHHQVDLSDIQGRGQMQSIFQALQQSPRQSRDNQSLTMKMLQLQVQKNKQISKISELKQKFFHIRMIVLNLLKSLQLQSSIKSECLDILRLLFDLFEYSEEERDSIFVKKKRLFSFL